MRGRARRQQVQIKIVNCRRGCAGPTARRSCAVFEAGSRRKAAFRVVAVLIIPAIIERAEEQNDVGQRVRGLLQPHAVDGGGRTMAPSDAKTFLEPSRGAAGRAGVRRRRPPIEFGDDLFGPTSDKPAIGGVE